MYAQATTTVTVRRGTSTTALGDVVDTGASVATGLPMSILQQRRAVTVPADARVQEVVWFTGRTRADADVRKGDQVQDERTSVTYRVDDVYRVPSAVTTPDLTLSLRIVG